MYDRLNPEIEWDYQDVYCTEFDNETWGRKILETGQVFCSQCGATDHRTT